VSTQDPHRPTSPAPRIYGTPASPATPAPESPGGPAWPPHARDDQASAPGAPVSGAGAAGAAAGGGVYRATPPPSGVYGGPSAQPARRESGPTPPANQGFLNQALSNQSPNQGLPNQGLPNQGPGNRGAAPTWPPAPNAPVSPAGTAPVPPGQPPAPPKERRRQPLPIVISLIALVLALASAGLSWRASTKAQDAADRVTALLGTRTSAPQRTATPVKPADDQPTATPTTGAPIPAGTGEPKLTATTDFKVNYADRVVTIPASCSNNIYVDLDEPRVQVPSDIGEVLFHRECGATAIEQLRMQPGVLGALMTSSAVTPGECVDQIRDNPLPLNDNAPATVGQVFCVQSNYSEASTSGLTWKMVVLTVTAIARDGKVGLKLSAWDIPG
jgi:hypothetical protein